MPIVSIRRTNRRQATVSEAIAILPLADSVDFQHCGFIAFASFLCTDGCEKIVEGVSIKSRHKYYVATTGDLTAAFTREP